MNQYPKLRIVIPARAGSTRIHRKNLQEIVPGKSLLQWCIEFYQRCLPGVPIVVATEDHETNKLALSLKCQLHGRCLEDIQDTRDGYGVLSDMIECYPGDTIMMVQCTSPFTFRSEVERAIETPRDYVQSATSLMIFTSEDPVVKTQDKKPTVVFSGNFYIARKSFPDTSVWRSTDNVSFVSWLSSMDIDVQDDLDTARLLAKSITIETLLQG